MTGEGGERQAADSTGRRAPTGRIFVVVAGLGALLAFALAIPRVWVQEQAKQVPHTYVSAPVSLALLQSGVRRGSAYLSNQRIHLRWAGAPDTAIYRLQIVAISPFRRTSDVFRHPTLTAIVYDSSFSLPVVGAQRYYWRVQPFIDGAWQGYSRPRSFTVQEPTVGAPFPLSPRSGSLLGPAPVRLCWSAVPHAIGYEVLIEGHGARTLTGTCLTVQLGSGTYAWRVAAFLQGARIYSGPTSRVARFGIVFPRPPERGRILAPSAPVVVAAPAPARAAAPAVLGQRFAARAPVARLSPYRITRVVSGRSTVRPQPLPASRSGVAGPARPRGCIAFVNC